MGQVIESEIRITQNTPGVTVSLGVANQSTKVAEFIVPDRSAYVIRPGDIFSLTLADTTPTALAGSSAVKLVHADPQSVVQRELAAVDYTTVTEFLDRNKLYTIGQRVELRPDDRLQVYVTGNLAAAIAQTRFQVSALRGLQTII